MSDDKTTKRDDSGETKPAAVAAAEENGPASDERNLEEGLDESFPGSDAPASTRRSSASDRSRTSEGPEDGDPSGQPS